MFKNKNILVVLISLGLCSTLFASEISELYKEFLRRDAIVLTKEQGQIFAFLKNLKYEIKDIKKLELLDPNDPNHFVFEAINGDVCLGDITTDLLRCKNIMGITTINFIGDAD
jgi:hypothetical protein